MALSDNHHPERDEAETTLSQSSQSQTNQSSSESVPSELVDLLLEMMNLNKTEQPPLETPGFQPESLPVVVETTTVDQHSSQTLQSHPDSTNFLIESGNSELVEQDLSQMLLKHLDEKTSPIESENSPENLVPSSSSTEALEQNQSLDESLGSSDTPSPISLDESGKSENSQPDLVHLSNSIESLAKLLLLPPSQSDTFAESSQSENSIEVETSPDTLSSEIHDELKDKLAQLSPTDSTAIVVAQAEQETDLITPFEQLQNLLMGNNFNEVRDVVSSLDEKLTKIHQQLYDPKELLELLLPLIAELLSRKVSESKEEVSRAIVPIIDQVIRERAHEDKQAMSSALASVIPPAITKQINDNPEEIANAIGPTMGKAIKEQIRVEKDAMVDALYPVIGNTVAKYLAEAIRSINDKISNALSVEGVSRKVRARMQGVSEGELIFRESIPFTVQAIFLIHKASGLVIAEIQNPGGYRLESEMVAGMLTAIRSFVNECIVRPGEVSELNEIEYGDSKIILEVAGYCYQAVVIQGEPTKRFIQKMRLTLSSIILQYGQIVEQFDGDPSKIPSEIPALLEALIQAVEREKDPANKPRNALLGLSLLFLSLMIIPWGFFQYRQNIERRIEVQTATALTSAPELAVYRLEVDAEGERLILTGKLPNNYLRAKAEEIARSTVPNLAIENHIIAVDVPPDPVLVAAEVKRVTSVLNQVNDFAISAQYESGKVTTQGEVFEWADAEKISAAFEQIPGVQSVVNTLQLKPLAISTRIYFESGSVALKSAERNKLREIKTFLDRHPEIKLQIIGHSDSQGNPVKNQQLALQRAESVRVGLVALGIAADRLQVIGINQPPADVDDNQPLWMSRCVKFEPMTSITPNK